MIEPKHVKTLILSTNGKIFSARILKKDGTSRWMNCRLGVTKYLKGGVSKNTNENHLVVYDLQNKGYRTINCESVIDLKICGEFVEVL